MPSSLPLKKQQAIHSLSPVGSLRHFVSAHQRYALFQLLTGQEWEDYADLLLKMEQTVNTMPVTYEQDDKGMDSIAYLHYFFGGVDIFITEKDVSAPESDGLHHQAFGWSSLNGDKTDGDLGYISLPEILTMPIELDLHWTPKTLREALR